MRAFVADHSSSTGFCLADVPEPNAGQGVVVVAVSASSLNRGEVQHVRRYRSIPDGGGLGWDFAGTVLRSATDGTGPGVGEPVFGWSPTRGAWAEQLAVPIEHLARLPESVSPVEASTLGVAGLTATAALALAGRPLRDGHVVVTGATGGVGLLTTQLARLEGAHTWAVVRPATQPEWDGTMTDRVVRMIAGFDDADLPPPDLVVESVGGDVLSAALDVVADDGTVVTLGRTVELPATLPAGWFHKNAVLRGLSFSKEYREPGTTEQALSRLARLIGDGSLSADVGAVVPSVELGSAMDAVIDRTVRGKAVILW
jgi:NADPH2:quinone reductase